MSKPVVDLRSPNGMRFVVWAEGDHVVFEHRLPNRVVDTTYLSASKWVELRDEIDRALSLDLGEPPT